MDKNRENFNPVANFNRTDDCGDCKDDKQLINNECQTPAFGTWWHWLLLGLGIAFLITAAIVIYIRTQDNAPTGQIAVPERKLPYRRVRRIDF